MGFVVIIRRSIKILTVFVGLRYTLKRPYDILLTLKLQWMWVTVRVKCKEFVLYIVHHERSITSYTLRLELMGTSSRDRTQSVL